MSPQFIEPSPDSTPEGTIVDTEALPPTSAEEKSHNKLEIQQAEHQHSELETSNPALYQALTDHKAILWRREKGEDGEETYLIRATKDDAQNPRNWPNWKRYAVVGLAVWLNNMTTLCVSGYSTGADQLVEEFGVSSEIGTLGLSIYILGFAIGPMLLAPLSEFFGRRPVYLVSWGIFTIFQIPLAVAPNIATVLICRFIQGFAGSAPLANSGGVVHDCFGTDEGGYAVALYALSSVDGPPLGNALSGYLAQVKGWRWLFWVYLIVFGANWIFIYFFLPETRDTIILSKKSAAIRAQTCQSNIFAAHEQSKAGPGHLWKVSLVRPFVFLFTEPITYLCALINGFVYGMIFLSNEAFPLVFGSGNNGHNWTHSGTVNLTFLAYVVGSVIAFLLQPLQERAYRRALLASNGQSSPEARFWSSLWGTAAMPLGLFIAAWTSYPQLPWIAPLIGFGLFGFGFYIIIAAILNYVVDGYGHYSASALGGVVFVRNIVGAIFPLFAMQMFVKLGNQWSLCLLAFLSCLMIPIPFLLYYRGKTIRAKSPYCAEHFGKDD